MSMASAIGDRVLPAFAPKAGPGDFFRAFALPFSSIGLLFRSSKLSLLSLLSAALTFASLIGLVWLLVHYTDDWVSAIWPKPEAWYVAGLWYLFLAFTFVLLLVVGANTVPLVLLAPLQDVLSEAAEELCGDFTAPPFTLAHFAKQAVGSVAHTVKRVSLLLGGHALLFLLHFVPVAGSAAWTVSSTAWTMWWLAAEYLGAPMARHLYSFRDVQCALLSRKAAAFGFGAALYLLLWVPVLNFFLIPAAVVGGTLFFRGLRAVGHIGPSPGAGGRPLVAGPAERQASPSGSPRRERRCIHRRSIAVPADRLKHPTGIITLVSAVLRRPCVLLHHSSTDLFRAGACHSPRSTSASCGDSFDVSWPSFSCWERGPWWGPIALRFR